MARQVLALEPVRLGLFFGHVAVHDFFVRVVECQGGVDLTQGEVPDTRNNLLGLQPGLVPANNGAEGYTRAGNVRGAALDAGRAGNQGANVNVGYIVLLRQACVARKTLGIRPGARVR
jgi:flagellar basal body rod protein FlgF